MLFYLDYLLISQESVSLQCVFHSIRFKVNKGWSKALLLFYVRTSPRSYVFLDQSAPGCFLFVSFESEKNIFRHGLHGLTRLFYVIIALKPC